MSRIFGAIRQNGYVVRDIQAAMDHWITVMGVGPWFYIPKVGVEYFRYHGVDSAVEMSIALANSGDLQIELIQQRNDAPSMYKDFLDAGREGLQHEGQIGGSRGRFSYFETESHPGTVIEISDISGRKGDFFEQVKAVAADWDGSDPIRSVG